MHVQRQHNKRTYMLKFTLVHNPSAQLRKKPPLNRPTCQQKVPACGIGPPSALQASTHATLPGFISLKYTELQLRKGQVHSPSGLMNHSYIAAVLRHERLRLSPTFNPSHETYGTPHDVGCTYAGKTEREDGRTHI